MVTYFRICRPKGINLWLFNISLVPSGNTDAHLTAQYSRKLMKKCADCLGITSQGYVIVVISFVILLQIIKKHTSQIWDGEVFIHWTRC